MYKYEQMMFVMFQIKGALLLNSIRMLCIYNVFAFLF